jgi:hypothetical protein
LRRNYSKGTRFRNLNLYPKISVAMSNRGGRAQHHETGTESQRGSLGNQGSPLVLRPDAGLAGGRDEKNQGPQRNQVAPNSNVNATFQQRWDGSNNTAYANGMPPYPQNGCLQYPQQFTPPQYPYPCSQSPYWPYDAPTLQYSGFFNFFSPSYPPPNMMYQPKFYNQPQAVGPPNGPIQTPSFPTPMAPSLPPVPSASGYIRIDGTPLPTCVNHAPPSRQRIHIPEPTQDYLLNASLPPYRLETATTKLLVLDLNGTLLFRPRRDTGQHRTTRKSSTQPLPRPHLAEFITYIFRHFKVMFWSSATPANVKSMIAAITTAQQRNDVVATWARDTLGLTPKEYNQKVITLKDLRKIFQDQQLRKTCKDGWDIGNTILLDDSVVKASYQPYNHVCLPEYVVNWTRDSEGAYRALDDSDDALWQVAGYLDELRYQGHVGRYIKQTPFRLGEGWHGMCLGLA